MTRFDHIKLDSLAESNNQVLKGLFNTVYEAVNQTCGNASQEKSMALMYLEQSYMWALKALMVAQLENSVRPAPDFQHAASMLGVFNPSQSVMPNLVESQRMAQSMSQPQQPTFSADGLTNSVAELTDALKKMGLSL